MTEESEIARYYDSKKILITGGTGFMGKVLIWKLLHSCSKVDKIYVLIRSKYGNSPLSRKGQLFGSPIFDTFKKSNPKILDKVVLISGDVGEDRIGLSEEDRDMFIEGVSIIFHSAAILKMDADLRTAVNVNTIGTVRLLELAQKMKKLEAFVYISTAYCCCENSTVGEKIYPTKHNPYDVMKLVNWMDPDLLKKITPKLIYPLPNTYIYSKRLTEFLLQDYVLKVPIIVGRPSIVVPSFKEPLPGWTDNLNGPVGFFTAAGRGIIRTTTLRMDTESDIIPVDMAINSVILLPWANPKEQLLKQISVFNITQNSDKKLTWGEVTKYLLNVLYIYPPDLMFWYPNPYPATKSTFIYTFKLIFLHYLPAYIIDFILLLVGQKPFLVKVHDKLRQGNNVITFFTRNRWEFMHNKLLELEKRLNDTDKKLFFVNMNEMKNFQDYITDVVASCKVHLFKEDINKNDFARNLCKTMYVLDKITLALRYYFLWKILVFIFNLMWSIFT